MLLIKRIRSSARIVCRISLVSSQLTMGQQGQTALLVDVAGNIVARGYQEFTQYYPHPGWVEHDPEEIWHATLQAIDALFGETVPNIIALGITNQRETTLIWDRRTGKPIYPAIVWQCRRTADRCTALEKQGGRGRDKDENRTCLKMPTFRRQRSHGFLIMLTAHGHRRNAVNLRSGP